jgi:hypothetical protein
MLTHPTDEGLLTLNLVSMAEGLAEQRGNPDYEALAFEERLGLLVDRELLARENRRMARNLKTAKLKIPAAIEDIDFRRPRGLDRAQVLSLADAHFVEHHQAILIVGQPEWARRIWPVPSLTQRSATGTVPSTWVPRGCSTSSPSPEPTGVWVDSWRAGHG